jgi:hypothetical protein
LFARICGVRERRSAIDCESDEPRMHRYCTTEVRGLRGPYSKTIQ